MTRQWVLLLPWHRPPYTLNDRYGKWEAHRIRTDIRDVTAQVLGSSVPRGVGPLTAELVWYPGNDKVADSDNIAPTLKHCLDALKLRGIVPDDNPKHVVRTMQRVVPRSLDPHGRKIPELFLVLTECAHADMPHYLPGSEVGKIVTAS